MDNEKTEPLISVIVPVYNKAPFLHKCADSIAAQNVKNLEVLFVDDGSTDNSLQVLNQIHDQYGYQIIHTENGGVSHARNTGIEASHGDYLIFVDGDDGIGEGGIQTLFQLIQKLEYDLVGGEACLYDTDGKRIAAGGKNTGKIYQAEGKTMLEDCLKDVLYTHHVGATIFRRSLIEDVRFPLGIHAHEDAYFMFQCALKQPKAAFIDKQVVWYTAVPGSLSRSPMTDEKAGNILDATERMVKEASERYPEYEAMAKNKLVKAALSILYGVPSRRMEKQCSAIVRKYRKSYIPGASLDRMLYILVMTHLYPVYAAMQSRRLYHQSRKNLYAKEGGN